MEDYTISKWYVLQALSGQEGKAMRGLLARKAEDAIQNIDDGIDEVVIPTERLESRKNGRKIVRERKLYPGYVLIKCRLLKEDGSLNSENWDTIQNIDGVIGFIGSHRDEKGPKKPVPLTPEDVELMLNHKEKTEEKPAPVVSYSFGETVIIKDGAFEGLEGVVESVDMERQRLKASVTIFGRSTPVEVEFWQVERP